MLAFRVLEFPNSGITPPYLQRLQSQLIENPDADYELQPGQVKMRLGQYTWVVSQSQLVLSSEYFAAADRFGQVSGAEYVFEEDTTDPKVVSIISIILRLMFTGRIDDLPDDEDIKKGLLLMANYLQLQQDLCDEIHSRVAATPLLRHPRRENVSHKRQRQY